MARTAPQKPRWWELRQAQNRKPATYRCPLCDKYLPALTPHVLITPEGDIKRRRHAHTHCVMAARKAGKLPTREEWAKSQARSERGSARGRVWGRLRLGRSQS